MASALVGATALTSTISASSARSNFRIPMSRYNVSSFRGFCTLPTRVHRASSASIKATLIQNVDISKVVPQADRVLVRLEELPEIDGHEQQRIFIGTYFTFGMKQGS